MQLERAHEKACVANQYRGAGLPRFARMSPDLLYWLSLAVKLLLTAGIVVTASIISERAGPLIGALVVTLPVTVWPSYVFLALEHDNAFIAETAAAGFAMCAINAIYILIYAVLGRRRNLAFSIGSAFAVWLVLAALARSYAWTFGAAAILNLVIYPACAWLGKDLRHAKMPPVVRKWYDVPFRTLLVCLLVGTVLVISNAVGPIATGFVAVFPISTTSTILILHPRLGGEPTAALAANGIAGLAGNGIGLAALMLIMPILGTTTALVAALVVPMLWNLSIWASRTRPLRARPR